MGKHGDNDQVQFNLKPLTLESLPPPGDIAAFTAWLDKHFDAGVKLANSMDEWGKSQKGELCICSLPNNSKFRKSIGTSEFWCGRISTHTPDSVLADVGAPASMWSNLTRTISNTLHRRSEDAGPRRSISERRPTVDLSDIEKQDRVVNSKPQGIYEKFRLGLLMYHSEDVADGQNERDYIEACRESECVQVLQPHVAEIWRLTYVTPAPTQPRTFLILLLSRELVSQPHGQRSFMNISLPFEHPDVPERKGSEKSHVRGKYVSVEMVREVEGGGAVEWRMATSSDAGGNIPRFVTNASLPKSISEDVPSFLKWVVAKYPPDADDARAMPHANGSA